MESTTLENNRPPAERHSSNIETKAIDKSRKESWVRWLLSVLIVPLFIAALSTYAIPSIIETSNRSEALRAARLKKALEVGDRNKEFNSRLNVLKTRMHTFNQQNVRKRLPPTALLEVQEYFQKEHTKDYLELDKTAWWWHWDVEREGEIFELLSPGELQGLHELLLKYGDNVSASIGAIAPMWEFLSSSEYSLSGKSQERVKVLEAEMNAQLSKLSDDRTQLIKGVAAFFARSRHVPSEP